MYNAQMKGVFRCHSKVYNGKLNLDSHGSSSPQTLNFLIVSLLPYLKLR